MRINLNKLLLNYWLWLGLLAIIYWIYLANRASVSIRSRSHPTPSPVSSPLSLSQSKEEILSSQKKGENIIQTTITSQSVSMSANLNVIIKPNEPITAHGFVQDTPVIPSTQDSPVETSNLRVDWKVPAPPTAAPVDQTAEKTEEVKLPATILPSLSGVDPGVTSNTYESSQVEAAPGNFPARISQYILGVDDIVFIDRFYSEHNLSFARTIRYRYHNSGQEAPAVASLSADAPDVQAQNAQGVHPLSWHRVWYKENYIVQKAGFASNFPAVAKQINKIRQSYHVPLAAIRYHTYTSHCKFLKSLGSPSVLPIPVMLTFRLDLEVGHYSGDTVGKTCIRRNYRQESGTCEFITGIAANLERCQESLDHFVEVLESPNILLLVTNQQHSISHRKILSLPLGVDRSMASEIIKFYNKKLFPEERSMMVAISNYFGSYSTSVIAHFSRFFHISASFDYDVNNQIDPLFVVEFIEKLSMSKFTLCPPGDKGYDSHRIWQSLLMGSIPIVEATPFGPGLEKSFSLLPVLVVPDLLQLKPNHLADAYECFKNNTNLWRFDILTQRHWDEMLLGALKTATIDHILADHPPYNPYCNFYLYNATGQWSDLK